MMAEASKVSMQKYLDPQERKETPGAGQIWNMNCEFCSTRKIKCSREATCNHCHRRDSPCRYPGIAKIVVAMERDSNRKDAESKKRKHERTLHETRESFPKPSGPWGSLPSFPAVSIERGGVAIPPSPGGLARFGGDLPPGITGSPVFWQPTAPGGPVAGMHGDAGKQEQRTPDGLNQPMIWSKSCDFCASRKIWCSRESICNHCRRRGQPCKYPSSAVWASESCHDRQLIRLAKRGLKKNVDGENSPSPSVSALGDSKSDRSGERPWSALLQPRFEFSAANNVLNIQPKPDAAFTSPVAVSIADRTLSSNPATRIDGGGEALQEMNCDFCAARKIKCSREDTCNQCRARGRACTYSRCSTGLNIRPSPPTGACLSDVNANSFVTQPSKSVPEAVPAAERESGRERKDAEVGPVRGASLTKNEEGEDGRGREGLPRSCQLCAARKIRCSREPVCASCRKLGMPCVYNATPQAIASGGSQPPATCPPPASAPPACAPLAAPGLQPNLGPPPGQPDLVNAHAQWRSNLCSWPPAPAGPMALSPLSQAPTTATTPGYGVPKSVPVMPPNFFPARDHTPCGSLGPNLNQWAGMMASNLNGMPWLAGGGFPGAGGMNPTVNALQLQQMQQQLLAQALLAQSCVQLQAPLDDGGARCMKPKEGLGGGGAVQSVAKRGWDLSCTSCAARKIKCGREEGQCKSCEKRGLKCTYPPSARLVDSASSFSRKLGGVASAPITSVKKEDTEVTKVPVEQLRRDSDNKTVAKGPESESTKGPESESTPSPRWDDASDEGSGGDGGMMDAAVDALVQLAGAASGCKRRADGPHEDKDGAARISISQLL